MNREEAKILIPIIQAFAEGKVIQYKTDSENDSWENCIYSERNNLRFDGELQNYRIKPEPEVIYVTTYLDRRVVSDSLGYSPACGKTKKFIEVME